MYSTFILEIGWLSRDSSSEDHGSVHKFDRNISNYQLDLGLDQCSRLSDRPTSIANRAMPVAWVQIWQQQVFSMVTWLLWIIHRPLHYLFLLEKLSTREDCKLRLCSREYPKSQGHCFSKKTNKKNILLLRCSSTNVIAVFLLSKNCST